MRMFVYGTHPHTHSHKPHTHTHTQLHILTPPYSAHHQLPLTPEKTATSVSAVPTNDNFGIHILPVPMSSRQAGPLVPSLSASLPCSSLAFPSPSCWTLWSGQDHGHGSHWGNKETEAWNSNVWANPGSAVKGNYLSSDLRNKALCSCCPLTYIPSPLTQTIRLLGPGVGTEKEQVHPEALGVLGSQQQTPETDLPGPFPGEGYSPTLCRV